MTKNEKLCLERDAGRCCVCGNLKNISVVMLSKRKGRMANHLSNLITLCCDCIYERENISVVDNRVGILLCGGKATRLYPLTRTINKHILAIGIVPMAFYPIRTLRKFGIKKVLIVVDQFSTAIIDTLGSGKMFGMDFSYKLQSGSFGIADALYLAKDFVQPGDEIICMLGDNIVDNDVVDTSIDLKNNKACVYLKEVENPSDYGIAMIQDGHIKEIIEKPKTFVGNSAVIGLYAFTYDIFSVIDGIKPSARGELEISSVNDYYAKTNNLSYKIISGYWADCGASIQKYCEASLHGARIANVSQEEMNDFISTVFDDK